MSFNQGFPMGYQPQQFVQPVQQVQPAQQVQQPVFQQQQPQVVQQQNSNAGIIWVQGDAGARSYAVAPNQSVMLMDSEADCFYIKSADASGMPLPLRIFDYKERIAERQAQVAPVEMPPEREPVDLSGYVTKEEFDSVLARLEELSAQLAAQTEQFDNKRRK